MEKWIWQHTDWPKFIWDKSAIANNLVKAHHLNGYINGCYIENPNIEPTRLFRRQFILSHATLAGSSSWR